MKTLEITTAEMQSKIENAIAKMQSFGYSRKDAERIIKRGLNLVKQGKKSITDILEF